MTYLDILTQIKASLNTIYPSGDQLTKLSELLELNPRSIRRKLSGENQFTLRELSKIAKYHSLSLSEMFDSNKNDYKHPMQLFVWNHTNQNEFESVMKKITEAFTVASQSVDATLLHTNNFIPYFTLFNSEKLVRYQTLRWLYHSNIPENIKRYSEITFYSSSNKYQKLVLNSIKRMDLSRFILNKNFFRNSLVELVSFYKKNFINREEYLELLEEFSFLLKKFKMICDRGYFIYKEKKVEVYFTDLWLTNSLNILKGGLTNLAGINAHYWDIIVSRKTETFDLFEKWFNSWLQVSNCVSLCSERQRLEYINIQRKAISDAYDFLQTGVYPI